VGEGHVGLLGQGQANGRRDPIVLGGLLAGWRSLAADGTEIKREGESHVLFTFTVTVNTMSLERETNRSACNVVNYVSL